MMALEAAVVQEQKAGTDSKVGEKKLPPFLEFKHLELERKDNIEKKQIHTITCAFGAGV